MKSKTDRLALLETFVRITEAGSISGAARLLGVSQPSVSRQLAALEAGLRTQLVRRTTHSLALTDAGTELLADARQLLDSWEVLAEKHVSAEATVQGRLKVVAPIALGQQQLVRIACNYQRQHPGVGVTWVLDDQQIRFAESGCDCWIRVGPIADEGLIVKRLGAVERLLVGARALLPEGSARRSPADVRQLPLVALEPYDGDQIPLLRGKRTVTVAPPVQMRTNNIFALREAALQGVGMAVLPRWFIAEQLKRRQLINLLPDWQAPSLPLSVAFLPGRHQPLRLRAFIDLLVAQVPKIEGIERPVNVVSSSPAPVSGRA
ncbi:MAG: LysR family transcriptional regulator [Pseudomonadota bacterium]